VNSMLMKLTFNRMSVAAHTHTHTTSCSLVCIISPELRHF